MNVSTDWPVWPNVPNTHPHWLQYPPITPEVGFFLGSVLLLIGAIGVLGNALVLFVFTRFRRLRGPFSCFIVNLAIADISTSLLHAVAASSSFKGHWIFGQIGCMLYACGVGYFGLLSIVILSAIAVERYMVITAKPLSGSWKMTQYGARKVCVGAWVYCLALALPPLFGWSSYNTEGFLTSCSWDYITQSTSNRAYYIYLLTLGFVVPVSVITYCYTFILAAIFAHGKEMVGVKATGGGGGTYGTTALSSNSRSNGKCSGASVGAKHSTSSSTIRTANIIIMLVALFVISWTPYTVVTMIGQFGDVRLVTPWVATMPALFAKASVVYNPIVYGLSHPHFRSSVAQYLSACKTGNSLQNTSMMPVVAAGSMTRKQSHHKHDLHPRAPSSGSAGAAVIYKNPVNHHHIHQTHFRCFPHQNREDSDYFYSEPEPPTRPVSCLVKYGEAGRNICCVSRVRHLKTSSSHAEARPIQDLL